MDFKKWDLLFKFKVGVGLEVALGLHCRDVWRMERPQKIRQRPWITSACAGLSVFVSSAEDPWSPRSIYVCEEITWDEKNHPQNQRKQYPTLTLSRGSLYLYLPDWKTSIRAVLARVLRRVITLVEGIIIPVPKAALVPPVEPLREDLGHKLLLSNWCPRTKIENFYVAPRKAKFTMSGIQ